MNLETIYDSSPIWIQNLMCSIKGYMIVRERFGKNFMNELQAFEVKKYDGEMQLGVFLNNVKNTPAYSSVFSQNPDLNGKELLEKFPIVGKIELKQHLKEYINKGCTEPMFTATTSGTTGGGLVFPCTNSSDYKKWAVWWRYRRALGIQLDTWCAWFGGKRIIDPNSRKPPFWRINRPGKQVMFSSLHLTLDTVESYRDEIDQRKLPWVHGYPSHIAKFAGMVIDRGLQPLSHVKYVTTGAENVLGNQIELMKKVFPNALIRQHYGLAEGVANFSQDVDGNWHIDDDYAYVEFIPVSEGNPNICRIVGTSIWNEAFPLIRYDTGDIATIQRESDGSIKVLSVDGRSGNVLKGPDGFEINEARLSIVLHDFNNIMESQFHQKTLTDIDLLIVRNHLYNEKDETQLKKNIAENFDRRINVNIKYVDSIQRTAAGKLKLVISDL